jgi:glycosyltransferase involved in cell wall biosynthesis
LPYSYYGFPDKVVENLRKDMGNEKYEAFYGRVMALLQQEGIRYYGAVGHVELLKAYASAGFLLYPTHYPETGCITVQKAMACGAIPLTSSFTNSVLPALTAGFDLGPERALTPQDQYNVWMEDYWLPAVVAAALKAPAELSLHREGMKASIREVYTWRNSAEVLVRTVANDEYSAGL